AIVSQRLVRRLCTCARESDDPSERLGLAVERAWTPVGCDSCGGTGYQGRMVLAEWLMPEQGEIGSAILSRQDVRSLERVALDSGMISRWERARNAVEAGLTSPSEVRRVLGIHEPSE
ncbi:ATPase, T2SS/T4P/T4SS family, partial [Singulisphaera rosea]